MNNRYWIFLCLTLLTGCASEPLQNDIFRGPASDIGRINRSGTFARFHDVTLDAPSQTDCESAEGKWDGQKCVFQTADIVTVSLRDDRPFVRVSVSNSAGAECEFESFAASPTPYKLVARAADSLGDCTVALTYANSNKLAVSADDSCGCQKGVELSIPEAIRIKKFFR